MRTRSQNAGGSTDHSLFYHRMPANAIYGRQIQGIELLPAETGET